VYHSANVDMAFQSGPCLRIGTTTLPILPPYRRYRSLSHRSVKIVMQRIKPFFRRSTPRIYRALSRARAYGEFAFRSPEIIFTRFSQTNRWGSLNSHSGIGSDLEQTTELRRMLPTFIAELQCRSVVDVPCGDYFWMSHIDLDVDRYIGADIVSALVDANRAAFGDDSHSFMVLDLTRDELPPVDLIFCRDCLVHLSYADAGCALRTIRSSRATYLLTTTYIARDRNYNIPTGSWRPINLERPPFNFPPPLKLIDERCTEGNGQFTDKHLGLWRVADLPCDKSRRIGSFRNRGTAHRDQWQ